MSAASVEATVPASGYLPRFRAAALPLLLALGLVALAPSSEAAQSDDAAALAVLRRAVAAASVLSYRGVQVDATWTASGMTTRMIDVRQTAGLRWLAVRASGGTSVTTSSTTMSLPVRAGAGPVDPLTLIAAAYAVSAAGKDEVVGRSASVVVAMRGGLLAARLWIDDGCGLLLRQEVWDSQGRLTRMTSFVELEEPVTGPARQATESGAVGRAAAGVDLLGPAAGGARAASDDLVGSAAPGGRAGAGAAEQDPEAVARWLHSPCPAELPGGFRLVDARQTPVAGGNGPEPTAVHLTYSDGLSAMSVFVQTGRLPSAGPSGMAAQTWGGTQVYLAAGWPVRAVWQGDGRVFTVVSDAPVEQVSAAAGALPGIRTTPGALERVAIVMRMVGVLLPGR